MRTALIPPVPDLDRYATGTGIHLLLSHLFKKDGYVEYYRERSEAGDYVILDNSAHEFAMGNKISRLLDEAERVEADEVVIPDVLFDAKATVEAARHSLRWLETPRGRRAFARSGRPRFMYVPQGEDRQAWAWCLKQLLSLHDTADAEYVEPVIGISKDYYYWQGGIQSLIRTHIAHLRASRPKVLDLHILGWPTDLWQTASIAREFPWVRSTDSAKPFVYAKNDVLLEPGGKVPDYPRRDKRYFDEPIPYELDEIVRRNVAVFEAAATDCLILEKV